MQLSKPCRAARRRGVRGWARWPAGPVPAGPVPAGPVPAGPVPVAPVPVAPVPVGPALMTPVRTAPVLARPVLAGVPLTGLVLASLVLASLVLASLVLASLVLAAPVLAGLAVVPAFVRVRVPAPAGGCGVRRGHGPRTRHSGALRRGGQRHGEQGRRGTLRHATAAAAPARRGAGAGEVAVSPPQAAQDGQHPAAAPGVGSADRYARIRERGAHLLILGIAGHRSADLRQGPDRSPGAPEISHGGGLSRSGIGRLDTDRRGAADQVRGALLIGPRLAEVDRMPVVADTPAGIAVQPVHWPARGDPDGVPGEPDYLEPGPGGLHRKVHRGRPGARPGVRRRKYSESRINESDDQCKSDYPTHLHPPNAITPATAGGRRQAFRLFIPWAFSGKRIAEGRRSR